MDNRLTLHDIAALLAEHSGKSVPDSELFLQELIQSIVGNLCEDKIVEVKGTGTFELIEKESQEIISDTGNQSMLPAHYLFRFSPDKDFKELVNHPFSMFEKVEVSDGIEFPGLQKVELLEDEEENKEISIEGLQSKSAFLPNENTQNGISPSPQVTDEQKEELEVPDENISGNFQMEKSEEPDELAEANEVDAPVKEEPPSAKNRKISYSLLLGLILSSLICYYVWNRNNKVITTPSVMLEVAAIDTANYLPAQKDSIIHDTIIPPAQFNDLDTITIQHGDRLTSIARRYYGHKFFWVYIYEYNKDVISDPNNVPIGTSLRIPTPEKYGINANDRTMIEKAAAKQTEILSNLEQR